MQSETIPEMVQFIRQGEPAAFELGDAPHLENLNKEFRLTLRGEALRINHQEKIITPQEGLVGIIRIPSKTIVILPRFEAFDFNVVMRLWFFTRSSVVNLKKPLLPSYDLDPSRFLLDITNEFVLAVKEILQRGLVAKYVPISSNLPFVRGKIDYKEHLRRNPQPFQHVFCSFEEMSMDNQLNQIILFCLNKLFRLVQDPKNRMQLAALQYNFRGITLRSDLSAFDIDSSMLTHRESYYQLVLELCKIIAKNLFFSNVGGAFVGSAFLVDFDLLFEDFVKTILVNYYYEPGFSSWDEEKEYGYYTMHPRVNGTTENVKSYRPDILYKYDPAHETCEAVLDVKSKTGEPYANPDVFQMYFYCKKLHARKGILIYPSAEPFKSLKLFLKFPNGEDFSIYATFISLTGKESDFWRNIELFKRQIDGILSK